MGKVSVFSAAAQTPTGMVYVFNASPTMIRLALNNPAAVSTPIQPVPFPGQSPKPYTPFMLAIGRYDVPNSLPTNTVAFFNGQANTVTIQTQTGQPPDISLNIPATSNSTVNLWLYLFASDLLLFDTAGGLISYLPIDWSNALMQAKAEIETPEKNVMKSGQQKRRK